MLIRDMTRQDFEHFWPTFSAIILAQETYAFEPDMSLDDAYQLWCQLPLRTFVAEEHGELLGSYYLKANAMGPGSHVCNCGYMVSPAARGKGIASKLCEHSQEVALELNFKAMQFNSVVSTNTVAVALWKKLGFNVIGTIPKGYHHKQQGLVDCFIMHKKL